MISIINELNKNSINISKLEIFINYKFQDLYDFFSNQRKKEISIYKVQIESYLSRNLGVIRQIDFKNKINLKFIVMLIEACAKVELYMEFQNLYKLLVRRHYSFDKKLQAQSLYIVNIRRFSDYQNNYKSFLDTLHDSYSDERESESTLTLIYLNFYLRILKDFGEYNQENVITLSSDCMHYYENKQYVFLDKDLVNKVCSVTVGDSREAYVNIQNILSEYLTYDEKLICENDNLSIEKSDYSKKLYAIKEPSFNKIRQISVNKINSIGRPRELHDRLDRGRKIIDNEALLYQYIFTFSNMHKAKLYEAFETILPKLNNTTINIVDWGCGQAFATTLLLEYIKEKSLHINICDISLIEPSKLALSRGMLHLDVLKQKNNNIKAINKDIDCLEASEIEFKNNNTVLHLFSNILDVESFKLDKSFLQTVSGNMKSNNYFVCVSPNINDKRNGRLDLFYKYFDDNFDTDLISSRDMNIADKDKIYKRYEKVFEVNYTKKEDVVKSRDEIRDYHVDIYTKLNNFKSRVSPIIEPAKLIKNIEEDPDYVIFKIRKVTEIITSKIYSQHKNDESRVSQNNKIRYLSFDVPEDKRLTRKAISHLHTIRTIGNISVHEHIDKPSQMLKDDAYFLATALVLLLEEIEPLIEEIEPLS